MRGISEDNFVHSNTEKCNAGLSTSTIAAISLPEARLNVRKGSMAASVSLGQQVQLITSKFQASGYKSSYASTL